MIIYNVTSKLTNNIHERWVQWMKEIHIPEIMATGLFHDYRMCRLLEQDDQEGPTFTVQFFTDSLENYHTFMHEHAPLLRQKGYEQFGNQFIAFRTVMQVV